MSDLDLDYPDYLHGQTHPEHLAAVACLLGFEAASPRGARVLELGCAAGANLLPMAVSLPEAELVGLDLDARRISEGQGIVEAAGLGNVSLRAASVTEVDASWGQFDYIIAHGLFSWVAEPVREAVLRLCAERLTDGGVAFISYNTFPGWALRVVAGEWMRYMGRGDGAGLVWVERARARLQALVDMHRGSQSPLVAGLEAERKRLENHDPGYVYGEYAAQEHHPLYFHNFAEQARRSGLAYLGEAAQLKTLQPERYRPADASICPAYGVDAIQTQQYIDFATERYFRQSLLVRAQAQPAVQLAGGAIRRLCVAAEVAPIPDDATRDAQPIKVVVAGEQVREGRQIVKAALKVLGEAWPRSLSLADLLEAARAQLKWSASPDEDADRRQLERWAFEAFVEGQVQLDTFARGGVARPGPLPVASPLARVQALRGAKAATLRHERKTLGDGQRRMLPLLDGSRDLAALVEAMGDDLPRADGDSRLIPRGVAGVEHILQSLGSAGFLLS